MSAMTAAPSASVNRQPRISQPPVAQRGEGLAGDRGLVPRQRVVRRTGSSARGPCPASSTTSPGRARSKAASIAARPVRDRAGRRRRGGGPRPPRRARSRRGSPRGPRRAGPRRSPRRAGSARRRSGPSSAASRCRAPRPSRTRRSAPPPRAAATGASRSSTPASDAGRVGVVDDRPPNGWPWSIRSIRPGTPSTASRPGADRGRVEARGPRRAPRPRARCGR